MIRISCPSPGEGRGRMRAEKGSVSPVIAALALRMHKKLDPACRKGVDEADIYFLADFSQKPQIKKQS